MEEPRVGIGLPVFDGERYLAGALESLLAQSFGDFEVIVCDNASSDGTEEIARRFAREDARVRYHRNERNLGAAANFNLAFELARGALFKWAACDDLHAPDYLAACVEVLDRDAEVVLCHSLVRFIDADGEAIGDHEPRIHAFEAAAPSQRFRDLMSLRHWCFDVFGVARREMLARTPLIAAYPGSDRSLLVEIGLRGRLHRVPERLFLSREHPERSVRSSELRERAAWFDPRRAGRRSLPHWRLLGESLRAVHRVPLPFGERLACYATLPGWMRRFRGELLDDLRHGLRRGSASEEVADA